MNRIYTVYGIIRLNSSQLCTLTLMSILVLALVSFHGLRYRYRGIGQVVVLFIPHYRHVSNTLVCTNQGSLQTSSIVVATSHNQQTLLLIQLFSQIMDHVIQIQYFLDLFWNVNKLSCILLHIQSYTHRHAAWYKKFGRFEIKIKYFKMTYF